MSFDLNPRPAGPNSTKMMTAAQYTQEVPTQSPAQVQGNESASVGKQTFERELKKQRNKFVSVLLLTIATLIIGVGSLGYFYKDILFPVQDEASRKFLILQCKHQILVKQSQRRI